MENNSGKRLFTAELQMLRAKGAIAQAPAAAPVAEEGKVMAAIQALHDDVRTLSRVVQGQPEAEEARPEEVPAGFEVDVLKTEIRALYIAIQQTKSEIAALRPPHSENDRLIAVSNELDAIVTATESATHGILESSERIDTLVAQLEAQAGDSFAGRIADEIRDAVTAIFEHCNFQDITGQRITKVVKTLQFVEDRVNKMIAIWGAEGFEGLPHQEEDGDDDKRLLNGPALENEGVSQADIDKLFG